MATRYSTPMAPSQDSASSTYETRVTAESAVQSHRTTRARSQITTPATTGSLSGFVGAGVVLTGEAHFRETLRIDGQFAGRVTSENGTLVVSPQGQVDANIEVAIVQVSGTVNG